MGKENDLNFRPLKENEIECRVGNIARSGKGFFLLLYKNARVDQTILDETVGQWNWQCKYYQVKNTMVCSVGIYNEERKEWLFKDNGGDDDYQAEQVKAELSDAFKRACFNWGIGRELYYSPKIWVKTDEQNKNDPKDHYSVKNIEYDNNKRIIHLVIVNDNTKEVVFLYGKDTKVAETGDLPQKNDTPQVNEERGSIDKNDLKTIQAYLASYDSIKSKKVFDWLEKKYGTMNPEFLTKTQGKEVLKVLGSKQ